MKNNNRHYLYEAVFGVSVLLFSLYLFIKIKQNVFDGDVTEFDKNAVLYFYNLRSPALTSLMTIISLFGHQIVIFATAILAVFLLLKKHKRGSILFAIVIALSPLINVVLKNIIQRPRPELYLRAISINDYSFPSGHSMNAFVFYTTATYIVFHFRKDKRVRLLSLLLSILIILAVGLSRLYLGVHYPSDVIAGYLAGLAWFSGVLVVERILLYYKIID